MSELSAGQRRQILKVIDRTAHHLNVLAVEGFPMTISKETPEWQLALLGLLARSAGTLESIRLQSGWVGAPTSMS